MKLTHLEVRGLDIGFGAARQGAAEHLLGLQGWRTAGRLLGQRAALHSSRSSPPLLTLLLRSLLPLLPMLVKLMLKVVVEVKPVFALTRARPSPLLLCSSLQEHFLFDAGFPVVAVLGEVLLEHLLYH